MAAKKVTPTKRNPDAVTSVYLDVDSKKKLADLSLASGQSKSQVIRGLIQSADGLQHKRLSEIANELMDLVGSC